MVSLEEPPNGILNEYTIWLFGSFMVELSILVWLSCKLDDELLVFSIYIFYQDLFILLS